MCVDVVKHKMVDNNFDIFVLLLNIQNIQSNYSIYGTLFTPNFKFIP